MTAKCNKTRQKIPAKRGRKYRNNNTASDKRARVKKLLTPNQAKCFQNAYFEAGQAAGRSRWKVYLVPCPRSWQPKKRSDRRSFQSRAPSAVSKSLFRLFLGIIHYALDNPFSQSARDIRLPLIEFGRHPFRMKLERDRATVVPLQAFEYGRGVFIMPFKCRYGPSERRRQHSLMMEAVDHHVRGTAQQLST